MERRKEVRLEGQGRKETLSKERREAKGGGERHGGWDVLTHSADSLALESHHNTCRSQEW